MNKTSIITVNFNQPHITLDFLTSVKLNTDGEAVEVVLVDNGSLEDWKDRFLSAYPALIYIRSEKNLGFAGGNNLGIAAATGKYLLFLNNDTEITTGLVPTLISELERDPDIGIISPLILYFENSDIIQYAGFTEMNFLTCRNKGIGNMEVNKGQYNNNSYQTAYCHGAAMMCRKSDVDAVGLMPEHFFLYYEELDWCEMFKRTGKKIWFTGKTKIYHKESISVGKESKIKTYFMTRNRMLFIRRNTSIFNQVIFSLYYIFFAGPKQLVTYLIKGRKDLIKCVIRGIAWNLTHRSNSSNLGFKI